MSRFVENLKTNRKYDFYNTHTHTTIHFIIFSHISLEFKFLKVIAVTAEKVFDFALFPTDKRDRVFPRSS